MCATDAPARLFTLLVATLSLSIMCGNKLAAEGLPLRRMRGAADYEDILAGNEFLSVFLESSLRRARKETTTVTEEPVDFLQETIVTEPYIRTSRQAGSYFYEVPQSTDKQVISFNTSDPSSSDGVIIAVHVSSSIGSEINKDNQDRTHSLSESTTHMLDQNFLLSEEHSSIVAKSSKSELNVEEQPPITTNNDSSNDASAIDVKQNFPGSIQNLPASQHISFNPTGFINNQNKEDLPPFHHRLIYHDNPKEPGRARSVSYSTIIQAISPANEEPLGNHERKERNYETGMGYRNSYESLEEKTKDDRTNSKMQSNMYTPTSTTSSSSTTWDNYKLPSSSVKSETTEKNWEKQYSPMPITQQLPKVYGRAEQNYEVDESVSVVTNGRTHGVQSLEVDPTKKSKTDQEKDQKVGYVVEGRNYRKYRVEERTPDGFIVGEYGVVSHDDGSLRGVRYTADGTINPRLIYDALMKFLSL